MARADVRGPRTGVIIQILVNEEIRNKLKYLSKEYKDSCAGILRKMCTPQILKEYAELVHAEKLLKGPTQLPEDLVN